VFFFERAIQTFVLHTNEIWQSVEPFHWHSTCHFNPLFSHSKYVCHDSFICVSWLIHMFVMTHSYVSWLIHMCVMTLVISIRYSHIPRIWRYKVIVRLNPLHWVLNSCGIYSRCTLFTTDSTTCTHTITTMEGGANEKNLWKYFPAFPFLK